MRNAFDRAHLALGLDRFFSQHDPALLDSDDADKRADSVLSALGHRRLQSGITIPVNVGQDLYDVITLTDPCCGITNHTCRLLERETCYLSRDRRYEQCLGLSAR